MYSNYLDMFRATILPIMKIIRLCVDGRWSGKGVPALPDHRPSTHWMDHTTSCIAQTNAPDDGQNCSPKHVELIWIYHHHHVHEGLGVFPVP